MDRPRIYIQAGNPSSVSVVGCTFWGGDGIALNSDGDPQGLVEVRFSAFNRSNVVMTGCTFEGGTNSVPIFLVRSGSDQDSTYAKVEFGKCNILNGSYSKAVKSVTGTALSTWVIQSDHPDLAVWAIADENPTYMNAAEIFFEDSDKAEEYPLLPFTATWLAGGKSMIINNVGVQTTIQLSSGGTSFYNGDISIKPGRRYRLSTIRHDGVNKYFLQDLSGASTSSDGGTGSVENKTFSFPAGTIPEGEERRALVNPTNATSSDYVNVVLKNLPEGLISSTYFDPDDNLWKIKVVNAGSSTSSSFGTVTGIVQVVKV